LWAVKLSAKKLKVVIKRETDGMMINSYSPAVLKYWQANMDFVDIAAVVLDICRLQLKIICHANIY